MEHREECQDKRYVSFTLRMDAGQNDIHEFLYSTAVTLFSLSLHVH